MGRKKGKAIGKRVAIYVPVDEEPVLDKIAERLKHTRAKGYRTSFSCEVIRLLKDSLATK